MKRYICHKAAKKERANNYIIINKINKAGLCHTGNNIFSVFKL